LPSRLYQFNSHVLTFRNSNATEWNQTNHKPTKYALRTYLLKMAVMVAILQAARIWQFHIVFAETIDPLLTMAETGNEMYQDL